AGFLVLVAGLVWLGFHFAKGSRGDPRLIGTWQSNADATIAEQRKVRPITESQEVALRKLFGKVKITYTDKTLTTEFDGVSTTMSYEVVKKNSDSVVIKSRSDVTNQDQELTITFVGPDTYVLEIKSELVQYPLKEYFKRIR